jgi:hypothetical protein
VEQDWIARREVKFDRGRDRLREEIPAHRIESTAGETTP